jgi:preprotein translocase subunit YajC
MSLLNLLGIANAYAQTAAPTSARQGFISMLPMFIILILFMYFLILRPQSKRAKEQKELLGSLKQNDEVVSAGGILGTITKITDNFVTLKIAEGVEITMQKNSIASTLPKGTIRSV